MPNYSSFEERPLHPETGEPAAYYWVRWVNGEEVREPRWATKARPAKEKVRPTPPGVWLSTSEAGELIGKPGRLVAQWIREGVLAAESPPKAPGAQGRRRNWLINGQVFRDFVNGRPHLVARTSPIWEEQRRAGR